MGKSFIAEFRANDNPVSFLLENVKNEKQAMKLAKKIVKKNRLAVDRTITIKEIYLQ